MNVPKFYTACFYSTSGASRYTSKLFVMSASTQENSDSSIAQNPNVKRLLRKEHPSQILSQLNQFRLSNQLTDAVLLVDEEELHCHRYGYSMFHKV